jgi:FixJ family two-component response regulator
VNSEGSVETPSIQPGRCLAALMDKREIMALVASGLMSKQIAAEIGLSEITVKVHRSHIMKKMGARSVADLVRIAEALGVKSAKSQL